MMLSKCPPHRKWEPHQGPDICADEARRNGKVKSPHFFFLTQSRLASDHDDAAPQPPRDESTRQSPCPATRTAAMQPPHSDDDDDAPTACASNDNNAAREHPRGRW